MITDTAYANLIEEVRIIQCGTLQQVPNLVVASEQLRNGTFVRQDDDGWTAAGPSDRATHLVLKSAEPRLTATEISASTDVVEEGEPALTLGGGTGMVSLPVVGSIVIGDRVSVNDDGYAVSRPNSTDLVVGVAQETIVQTNTDISFCRVLVTLPALSE